MILKINIILIISLVYSVISIDPIHISNYLTDAPNTSSPTNFIAHLADACTLYEILHIQSEIFFPNTSQINRNNIFHFGNGYKTKIAQLLKYMNSFKYDQVGRSMYDVYINIHSHVFYNSVQYDDNELDLIEPDLKVNLNKIVTSDYWRENLEEIIISIPENLYNSLILKTKDTLHIDNEMNGLRDVCKHLLSSQEPVECFEKVLMNLNNLILTQENLKFAIMNYRTVLTCDYVASTTFESIVPLDSLKDNIKYLMKKQLQSVLSVYSELLSIMYNLIYIVRNSNNVKNYLNNLLEEFIDINEYTRGFFLYLHILDDLEISNFLDKFIKFQLLFRTHFEKFLVGVEDENMNENRYLKFLLKDTHDRFDSEMITDNNIIRLIFSDGTFYNFDISNQHIYTHNYLPNIFRISALLNNDEFSHEYEWKSVNFHSIRLISPLVSRRTNIVREDSFTFMERMNIVIFRRLVSQDLYRTLTDLVDSNNELLLEPTIIEESFYNHVFLSALPPLGLEDDD